MRFHVARAIQISQIEKETLEKLHGVEIKSGYPLANWNIQEFFGLPSLRTKCSIPDEIELQQKHSDRIEREIVDKKLFAARSISKDQIYLEWVHSFDWMIFNNKNRIVWENSSSGLMSRLRKKAQSPSKIPNPDFSGD